MVFELDVITLGTRLMSQKLPGNVKEQCVFQVTSFRSDLLSKIC